MSVRTGTPGRPALGSMSPGYSNSTKSKSKTPIADALIAKNKAERRELKLKEEFLYQNSLKEDD